MTPFTTMVVSHQMDRVEDMRRQAALEAQLNDRGVSRLRAALARLLHSWAARLDDTFESKPSTPTTV